MRRIAAALALALLVSPAMAKTKSVKEPRAGQFCSKAVGTTAQDSKGASLECKADKKGKPRWTKRFAALGGWRTGWPV